MNLQHDGAFLGTRLVFTTTPYFVRQCPLECMEGDIKALDSNGLEFQLMLRNVRYAPKFKDTLISVGQLWEESKVDVTFKDICSLKTSCNKVFPFKKGKGAGLYIWHVKRGTSNPLPPTKPKPNIKSSTNTVNQAMSFHATHSSKTTSHIA